MLILFILFVAFLVTLSVLKSNGVIISSFDYLGAIPYHDKIGHFVLMGILAYLMLIVLLPWLGKKLSERASIAAIIMLLTVLIGLEEMSQQYISTRSCCWSDFLFGVLGILVATYFYISRKSRSRSESP